jgi:hypothetical protein
MEIKQYIESGILESYVLGMASEQDKKAVECLSKIYPEIKQELEEIEELLFISNNQSAKYPPIHLKSKIFDIIENTPQNNANIVDSTSSETATKEQIILESESSHSGNQSKVIRMIPKSRVFAMAASFIILMGAISVFIYNQNKLAMEKLSLANNQELIKLKDELLQTKTTLDITNNQLAVFKNSDYKKIILNGIETKNPNGKAVVSWNPEEQQLVFSPESLPTPPQDKQYQLWAIADGVPVDLGVIAKELEVGQIQNISLAQLKNVSAFAITLEKNGGVPSPTLEELYLIGEVKS